MIISTHRYTHHKALEPSGNGSICSYFVLVKEYVLLI